MLLILYTDPSNLCYAGSLIDDPINHFQTKCLKSLTPDSPFYARAMSLELCKFNNTHYVPKEQMLKHYETCDSFKAFNFGPVVISLRLFEQVLLTLDRGSAQCI